MRVREMDTRVATGLVISEDYDMNDALVARGVIDSASYNGSFKLMADEVHDHYARRKKRGEIMIGSLNYDVQSRRGEQASLVFGRHPRWGTTKVKGDLIALIEPHMQWQIPDTRKQEGAARNTAVTGAYANVDDTPILGGEILGTVNDTVRMLRRPMGSAIDLVKRILQRRGNIYRKITLGRDIHDAAASLRASSQAWLEMQYGWKPIVKDVDAAFRLWDKRGARASKVRTVARSQSSFETRDVFKTELAGGYIPRTSGVSATAVVTRNYRAAAGVIYEKTFSPGASQTAADLGLSSKDLLTTAWELIPYSFVVDMFGNIGNWLQANQPKPNCSIVGSWCTTVGQNTVEISADAWIKVGAMSYLDESGKVIYLDPITYRGSCGKATLKRDVVTRTPAVFVPATPSVNPGSLGSMQSLNLAALNLSKLTGLLGRLQH